MRRPWTTLAVLLALGACGGDPPAAPTPPPPTPSPSPGAPTEAPAPAAAEPPPPPPPTRAVTVALAGDLVLNPTTMEAIREDPATRYDALLDGYRRALEPDDVAFLNLEMPLVDDVVELDSGWARQHTSRPRRAPILGGTPGLAEAMARAGADVVSVANNHAFDQGHDGLRRTVAALDHAGIGSVGATEEPEQLDRPWVTERGGLRVGFLAFTDSMNQRPARPDDAMHVGWLHDEEAAVARVRAAREEVDLLVVSLHWSTDFRFEVSQSQRRLARQLLDAGADVIAGAGPHVLQPVERVETPRGDGVVAYSLGNLVSGMGRLYRPGASVREHVHPSHVRPEARDGLVLKATFTRDEGRLRVTHLEGLPLWTENNWLAHANDGAPHRVRLLPLLEAGAEVTAERLPVVRAALGPDTTLPVPPG